ncbi:hypothetical protein CEXT_705911, partial [Caerostris extrusa]
MILLFSPSEAPLHQLHQRDNETHGKDTAGKYQAQLPTTPPVPHFLPSPYKSWQGCQSGRLTSCVLSS